MVGAAHPLATDVTTTSGSSAQAAVGSSVLRGSLEVLAGRVLARVLAFASSVLLARQLPPSEFGLFLVTMNAVGLLAIVARFGMDTAATRLIAQADARGRANEASVVARRTLAVGLGFTALMTLTLGLGGWRWLAVQVFHSAAMVNLELASLVLIFASTAHGTIAGWFRGLSRMRAVAWFEEFLVNLLWVVAVAVVVLSERRPQAATLVSSRTLVVLIVVVLMVLTLRWLLRPSPSRASVRYSSLIQVGGPFMATAIVAAATGTTTDILVIGHYRSASDVAHYGFAAALAFAVSMPYLAMATVFSPILASVDATEAALTQDRLRRVVGLISAPTIVVSVGLAALSKPILLLLAGPQYESAWPLLAVLTVAQCAFVITGPCGLALLMTGHQNASLVLATSAAVASVGADIWAAPRYGPLGVAIATSAVLVADNLITVVVAKRLTGILTIARFRWSDFQSLVGQLRGLRT